MTSSNGVVLFTKPAAPGRVKTRLVGPVTQEGAAALHAAFVRDTSATLAQGSFDLQVAWALDGGLEPMPELLPEGVPARVQRGADLGERLYRALRDLGQEGYARVAAVGSDHPGLPAARVEEAFSTLDRHEVAVGPVRDGGYDLIAVRTEALRTELFDGIAWSTDRVLEQTLERVSSLGYRVHQLALGADVDTPDDLEELRARLAREEGCPATRQALEGVGLAVGPVASGAREGSP